MFTKLQKDKNTFGKKAEAFLNVLGLDGLA